MVTFQRFIVIALCFVLSVPTGLLAACCCDSPGSSRCCSNESSTERSCCSDHAQSESVSRTCCRSSCETIPASSESVSKDSCQCQCGQHHAPSSSPRTNSVVIEAPVLVEPCFERLLPVLSANPISEPVELLLAPDSCHARLASLCRWLN